MVTKVELYESVVKIRQNFCLFGLEEEVEFKNEKWIHEAD
jgi:hypothetical protein